MRAKDNYDLLQLGFVREGKDPNESDSEDNGNNDNYESPVYDVAIGAKTMNEHAKEYDEVKKARLANLKALRKTAAHQKRSPFDQMLVETAEWMQYCDNQKKNSSKHHNNNQRRKGNDEHDDDQEENHSINNNNSTQDSASRSPKRGHRLKSQQEAMEEEKMELSQPAFDDDNNDDNDENENSKNKPKNKNNKSDKNNHASHSGTAAASSSSSSSSSSFKINDSPKFLAGQLRDYQQQGVNWLLQNHINFRNVVLADEMGLGKTFQSIATLAVLKFRFSTPGPHLIIAPKSVLGNWFREVRKWCPALSCFRFHASSEFRKILMKANLIPPIKYDVIVTTYEMVAYEIATFRKLRFNYLIVDEAHKLKNSEGQVHQALASLNALHRILVTGTPLQNDLTELWALLNFLTPELYDKADSFKEWFHAGAGRQDVNVIENLHRILEPVMLRRLKNDVNTGIPPKREIYVSCPVTRMQRQWYLRVLARDSESVNKGVTGGAKTESLSNIVMQLRKAIMHPYLFPEADETKGYSTNEKIVRDCGKMIVLDKLLGRLYNDVEGKHKCLIFSQMTQMLDIMEDYLIFRGYKYCRIDGSTSSFDRDMQMADFNNATSDKFVFLLSTRAGGLGINLQAANNVIIYDSDWNPQMDLQAQDRAHRIGQKREVRIFRLVTDNTIEQRIYERALSKLYLDAAVVQQGRIAAKLQKSASGDDDKVTKEEMMAAIRFGANEMFKTRNQDDDFTDADIDALLDKGEQKNKEMQTKIEQEQQASLASFKFGATQNSLYDFEGIDYNKAKGKGEGSTSKMIHVNLKEATPGDEIREEFSAYGEIAKMSLHPNLREVLITFKSLTAAVSAVAKSKHDCSYAKQTSVVSTEMMEECWDMGVKDKKRKNKNKGDKNNNDDNDDDDEVDVDEEEDEQESMWDAIQRMDDGNSDLIRRKKAALPKRPNLFAFQLFNVKRLNEIWAMECEIAMKNVDTLIAAETVAINEAEERKKADPADTLPIDVEAIKKQVAADTKLEALPPQIQAEKNRLMAEGNPGWSHADFSRFRQAIIEGIHREDFQAIAAFIGPTQTPESVREYAAGFWDYGHRYIPNFDQIELRAKKWSEQSKKGQDKIEACRWKVEQYENPAEELTFKQMTGKSNAPLLGAWVDRQLFLLAYEQNMKIDGIPEKIKGMPEGRFDSFLLTRPNDFFDKRLQALIAQCYSAFINKDKVRGIGNHNGAAATTGATDGIEGAPAAPLGARKRRRTRFETNQDVTESEKPQQPTGENNQDAAEN